MGKITLIIGGARSGKSSFAEGLLKDKNNVIYIATASALDDEMKDRIARHKETRNKSWITIEAYKGLHKMLQDKLLDMDYILIDCITIMVSNLMLENKIDWDSVNIDTVNSIEENILEEINNFLDTAQNFSGKIIIVTNEVGMGIVPTTPMARYYRDIAGRINQMIAKISDEVYLVISGISMKIKG